MIGVDRHNDKPWGAFGGKVGHSNDVILNPGPAQQQIRKVSDFPVPTGSLISLQSGGGGGYGDPWERDPEHVRDDVLDEYINLEQAGEQYGVVIRNGEVDIAETQKLRQQQQV